MAEVNMGTRVNIIIGGYDDVPVGASLFINTSHPEINVDELVGEFIEKSTGVSSLVRNLLNITYPFDAGTHKKGDDMFSVDAQPDDHEYIIRVHSDMTAYREVGESSEPLLAELTPPDKTAQPTPIMNWN